MLRGGFPLGWFYIQHGVQFVFALLLSTYLIATMPGKFRLGRFEMSWAGVLIAVICALQHVNNFVRHVAGTLQWFAALRLCEGFPSAAALVAAAYRLRRE
jgi:hypothetical protein